MSPTLQHSGKGRTWETIKRSVVARSFGGGRDEWMEHTGFLGQ